MGYGLSIHNMAREINRYVLDNKVTQILDEKMQEILDSFYLPFIGKAEKVNKVIAENADSMEIVDIEGNNVISSRAVVEENLVKTTEMIEDACDAVLEGKIRNKSCNKEKCKNCSRKQMCYEE